MKKAVCFIGPSGVGKSYYAKLLVKRHDFARPKTITTRKARPDDDNHIYVSPEEFMGLIVSGRLLEWDEYSGNYYGIMLNEFQDLLLDEKNNGVAMDLTLNGCRQVTELCEEAIVIALIPDDASWLKKRLVERGVNGIDEIERRMKISERDMDAIGKMGVLTVYCRYEPENTDEVLGDIVRTIKEGIKR
jgi:guanylate kinase